MKLQLVYVAGRYRAPTGWGVEQNITHARQWGAKVAEVGAMPVVPHANTAHYDGIQHDEFWLEGTMEMLRRCDAILMIPGWEKSSGARGEKAEAERLGLPVFYDIEQIKEWVEVVS